MKKCSNHAFISTILGCNGSFDAPRIAKTDSLTSYNIVGETLCMVNSLARIWKEIHHFCYGALERNVVIS